MLILMALNYRERTGEGQYLDGCQAEILMRALPHFTYHHATGADLDRTGNMDPTMAPSGIFRTGGRKIHCLGHRYGQTVSGLGESHGEEKI